MKRKTLTVEERAAFRFHDNHGIHDCDNKHCDRFIERLTKAIRAAVRAALRKQRGQIRALEMEQVNHIEIIHRNTEARVDAARAEGKALRKRRGTR